MQSSTTWWPDLLEQNEEYWKSPQGIQRRIDMIGEHFTYKIVNNAVKVYGATDGAKWVVWYTMADERVCAICGAYHMRRWRITWFTPRMPAHVNCFTPETLVDTSRGLIPIKDVVFGDYVLTHRNRYQRVRQIHRRPFEGDIHWLMGNGLTGNHAVLTPEGWCRADSLNEGNKVIVSTLRIESKSPTVHLEPYEIPPPITEEHLFTPILRPLGLGAVPSAAVNLYGQLNIGKGKIKVIDFKGILRHNLNSMGPEGIEELLFKRREATDSLHSLCPFNPVTTRRPISRGIMRSHNLSGSLFRGHLCPPEKVGFTPPTDTDTTFKEPIPNSSPGAYILGGKGFFGHSSFIEPDDLVGRQYTSHYLTPTLNDIYTTTFKGFVYNLTVAEDESYAVGEERLIVHNCRCYWMVEYKRRGES